MSTREPNKPSHSGLSPMRSIAIESPSNARPAPPLTASSGPSNAPAARGGSQHGFDPATGGLGSGPSTQEPVVAPAGSASAPPATTAPQSTVHAAQASQSGAVNPRPQTPSGRDRSSPIQGILATGSRFGSYVVGPCVGQGGMARVYSAQHEGLQRQVALKVLTQGLVGSDEHERFVREARLAAGIKHPNVVNIFDVGVEDGVPYLVMEFLEGEDLDTSLQTETSLSEDAIIDIMVPVVAGLTAVHDAGVIHRDLKPGNIFLTRGRHDEVEPKLLDFGISRSTCRESGKLTAERGLLMGTPFYMAPETIRGAGITEVSDQYSLGVVMYECAAGVNPFAADSFAEVVERVTSGNYPPLSQCNTAISPKLVRIVERAMSLDPNDRYADLRELGRDLLRLAGQRTRVTWGLTFGDLGSQLGAAVDDAPPTGRLPSEAAGLSASSTTAPPKRRRAGALFAVLGAAALLGAVVFGEGAIKRFAGEPKSPRVAQASLTPIDPPLEEALQPDPLEPIGDLQEQDSAPTDEASQSAKNEPDAEPVQESKSVATQKKSRRAKRRVSRRRRRRTVARKPPATAPTPAEAADDAKEAPAWLPETMVAIEAKTGRPVLGTNNAPILD